MIKLPSYIKNHLAFDAFFILLCYGVLFNQLGTLPIRLWDEGVYAVNALEMSQNHHYLIKYFRGLPELWATEPPLVAWLQTISIKLFGLNETAIRLPSALAGLTVVFLLIRFFSKEFNSRITGYFCALVLLSSNGYISEHITRTADLDSLLTLFTTGYFLYFYKYIINGYPKYLYVSTFFLICGIYTKSIGALLLLPSLFIFALFIKKLNLIFLRKDFYISLIIFIVVVSFYYILREYFNPGYLKTAWNNEIAMRYFNVNEGHKEGFMFYFNNLKNLRFVPWIYFLPFALLLKFLLKDKFEYKKLIIYSFISVIGFLAIISCSETKLEWYDAQLFPILSIIVGVVIFYLYQGLLCLLPERNKWEEFLLVTFFSIAIFCYPYLTNVNKLLVKEDTYRDVKYANVMKELKERHPEIKEYILMVVGFNPSTCFYEELYNTKYHYKVSQRDISQNIQLSSGELCVFYNPAVTEYLNNYYEYEIIHSYKNGEFIVAKVGKKKI